MEHSPPWSGLRTAVLMLCIVSAVPMSGCLDTTDYTVETSDPSTGAVFGSDIDTEMNAHWGTTYADVTIPYVINESRLDVDGTTLAVNATSESGVPVQVRKMKLTNGTFERDGGKVLDLSDGGRTGTYSDDFAQPYDGERARYQVRVVVDGRILDSVNVTVKEVG